MNLAKKGTVVSVKKISQKTIEVAMKVPDDFKFIAGQYIWLQIPVLKYPDVRGNTRMFSIASSPNNQGILSVIFRLSKSGFKKTLVKMKPGEELIFSGPYGSMTLPENKNLPVVIIAGGVGITPFLSMVRFSDETKSGHRITLISVNKNVQEMVYRSELEQIEKKNSDFKLIKFFGHIKVEPLRQFIDLKAVWYVIGPKDFVNVTFNILSKAGIPLKDIHFEEFYPSDKTEHILEQRLKSAGSSNPFFLAVESTSNHVIITDVNGVILYANKRAEHVTGYTVDEMKGNTPRLWGGLMSGEFYRNFWQLKKYEKLSYVGEITNRRKNQDEYIAFMNTSPILDGDSLIGYISTEEDITDQKERERDLVDSKIASRNVLEDLSTEISKVEMARVKEEAILLSIGDGLIATDENGKVLLINQMAEIMLGKKSKDIEGKVFSDAISVEDEKGAPILSGDRPLSLALVTGATTTTNIATGSIYYYMREDKTKFPVAVTVSPVIFSGKLIGAIEVFRDVTREKEVDKAKTEFVSLASHQLRTPLTAISWYTEMILKGDVGAVSGEQKKYLEQVYQGDRRMIDLVNTLLDVSRIELGTFVYELISTDIIALGHSVLDELKPKIEGKKITIKEFFSKDVPSYMTDPKNMRMVFENILTNAVDYTPEGGSIEFAISIADKKNILIKISDTGYGIPQNQQSKIFTKLFRADNVRDIDTDGTGLGLYIVKSIVEKSGGKIWFESEQNKGTTFYVEFPLNTDKDKLKTK